MKTRIRGAAGGLRASIRASTTASFCLFFAIAGLTPRAGADCATTQPATDPSTGRIEGPVVTDFFTQNASAATDFEGKFIVAFEAVPANAFNPNDAYVQRF